MEIQKSQDPWVPRTGQKTPYFSGEKLGVLKQTSLKLQFFGGGSNLWSFEGISLIQWLGRVFVFLYFFADWDPMGFSAIFDHHLGLNMFGSSFPSIQKSTLESKYGTPPKINGWNLKIIPWKRRNIDPNHQFWASMLVFRGVINWRSFGRFFFQNATTSALYFHPRLWCDSSWITSENWWVSWPRKRQTKRMKLK